MMCLRTSHYFIHYLIYNQMSLDAFAKLLYYNPLFIFYHPQQRGGDIEVAI